MDECYLGDNIGNCDKNNECDVFNWPIDCGIYSFFKYRLI